ncbi:hypothetical protein AA313_de0202182 [Arthrobotrys entomopaga]|nr:hypothetical protein AA313_de0202182 [Arthrobotrys entomopaga]
MSGRLVHFPYLGFHFTVNLPLICTQMQSSQSSIVLYDISSSGDPISSLHLHNSSSIKPPNISSRGVLMLHCHSPCVNGHTVPINWRNVLTLGGLKSPLVSVIIFVYRGYHPVVSSLIPS